MPLIPASLELFGLDTEFSGCFLLEQVERDVAQDGEVVWGVVFADTAVIFAKGDVEYPVQFVFGAPVVAHRLQGDSDVVWQAGDVTAGLAYGQGSPRRWATSMISVRKLAEPARWRR